MKKLFKATLWFSLFMLAALLGLRFAGLPYAEGRLAMVLHTSGFPQAIIERTELGFYGLGYVIRPEPGAEPMLELSLSPLGSLFERQLHIASARLMLGEDGHLPGYTAEASDEPAIKVLETPLNLPAIPLQADGLEVLTPLGPLTATITYTGGHAAIKWQLPTMAGTVDFTDEGNGTYKAEIPVTLASGPALNLTLLGGRKEPVVTLNATITAQPVGPVTLSDINVALNAEAKPGYVLPFTLTAKAGDKPVSVAGTIDLAQQTARGTATGDLKLAGLEAAGIKGTFELSALWPPVIKNGASVTAAALQLGGLPLLLPKATFGYANNKLNLQSATAGLFGGQVSLAPLQLALPLQQANLTANFTDLDLAQVLQLAAVDGLGGDGKLSGSIPVIYNAGKITLGEAQLKATGTGQIHYAPDETPSFLAEGGSGQMLGQVFSDFRYKGLTLTLGGTLGDNLTLGARLEGSNPKFYNGHSVAFNLNLSGALESLLTKGLQSFHFSPEDIKHMIQEGPSP